MTEPLKQLMLSSIDDIVEDILQGHEYLNNYGQFYDSSGQHIMTIYLGTNCDLYWASQCGDDCPGRGVDNYSKCNHKAMFDDLASRIGDPNPVSKSKLLKYVTRCTNNGWVYLARYNSDGIKQYRRDNNNDGRIYC